MANIPVKDAAGTTVTVAALGAGTTQDPHRPKHAVADGDNVTLGAVSDSAAPWSDDDVTLMSRVRDLQYRLSLLNDSLLYRGRSGSVLDENGASAVVQRRIVTGDPNGNLFYLLEAVPDKRLRILRLVMTPNLDTGSRAKQRFQLYGDNVGSNYYKTLNLNLSTLEADNAHDSYDSGFCPHGLLPEYEGEGVLCQPDENNTHPYQIVITYAELDGDADPGYPHGRVKVDGSQTHAHGAATVAVTMSRTLGTEGAVTVNVTSASVAGNLVSGVDFTAVDTTVAFADGASTASFNLVLKDVAGTGNHTGSIYFRVKPLTGGVATAWEIAGTHGNGSPDVAFAVT